jgi:RND family efflux transporter MFP subunit
MPTVWKRGGLSFLHAWAGLASPIVMAAALCAGLACADNLAVAAPATQPAPSVDLSEHEGLVAPSKEVACGSSLNGRLKAVPVEEGQRVKAGERIARLDDRVQLRQVAVAEKQANQQARIARAEAAVNQAKLKVKRLTKAFESDAASRWELDQALVERAQAQADLRVAKHRQSEAEAELALQQARLERYRLRAPFTGWVDEIHLSEGATMTAEKTILTLLKLDPLEAELQLPVALYGHLKRGRQYRLKAGMPVNQTVKGRLTFISKNIDPASRTFRCVFTIDNPKAKLPAGFPVHLASLTPMPTEDNVSQRQQARSR